jgi:signal transduction histidine kinase
MSQGQTATDARWDRLLALAVHEFRTPVTVVAGYISMLLKDRAGPLSDQQRRLLEESAKSTARLSALIAEMSDLASIEEGKTTLNRGRVDFGPLVADVVATRPPLTDRDVNITLDDGAADASVQGDAARLKSALGSVLFALRRELVTSTDLMVRVRRATEDGRRVVRISIADDEHIDRVERASAAALGRFDEWRGGCGLSLALARRVINRHEGSVWSPLDDPKAGAVIVLPES